MQIKKQKKMNASAHCGNYDDLTDLTVNDDRCDMCEQLRNVTMLF